MGSITIDDKDKLSKQEGLIGEYLQGRVKPEVEKGGVYVEASQFPGEATILEKIQKAPTNLGIRYLHKNLNE